MVRVARKERIEIDTLADADSDTQRMGVRMENVRSRRAASLRRCCRMRSDIAPVKDNEYR